MTVLWLGVMLAGGSPELAVRFDGRTAEWIESGVLDGQACELAAAEVDGRPALRLRTSSEFCDGLVDLRAVAGGPVDFRDARWLRLVTRVPADSRVAALKLNFRDADGNFGGVSEVVNTFAVRPGEWVETVVDLRTVLPSFAVWHGEGDPLPAVTHLSLNPYCADQSRPSDLYVAELELTAGRPTRSFEPAFCEPPGFARTLPLRLDFDDEQTLRRMTAVRSFEASGQALRSGVAGNATTAVRLTGLEKNRYIAFLPMFDRLCGGPLDLTNATHIRFRYHLRPGGDPVDGFRLFIVTEGWQTVAVAEDAVSDLKSGGWHEASITLADLKFSGDAAAVLPAVAEMRLDLKHRGGKGSMDGKDVTLWLDDFVVE